MKLKCELFSIEIDGSYMFYSGDRSVFPGMLRAEPMWAQLLESLGADFELQDIAAYLTENGLEAAESEKLAGDFAALLCFAGIAGGAEPKDAMVPGAELIMPEKEQESYATMNTGCYYNSCCDCVEFNGWMNEDNEKTHINPLL